MHVAGNEFADVVSNAQPLIFGFSAQMGVLSVGRAKLVTDLVGHDATIARAKSRAEIENWAI